jgi:hypothetical protein
MRQETKNDGLGKFSGMFEPEGYFGYFFDRQSAYRMEITNAEIGAAGIAPGSERAVQLDTP